MKPASFLALFALLVLTACETTDGLRGGTSMTENGLLVQGAKRLDATGAIREFNGFTTEAKLPNGTVVTLFTEKDGRAVFLEDGRDPVSGNWKVYAGGLMCLDMAKPTRVDGCHAIWHPAKGGARATSPFSDEIDFRVFRRTYGNVYGL